MAFSQNLRFAAWLISTVADFDRLRSHVVGDQRKDTASFDKFIEICRQVMAELRAVQSLTLKQKSFVQPCGWLNGRLAQLAPDLIVTTPRAKHAGQKYPSGLPFVTTVGTPATALAARVESLYHEPTPSRVFGQPPRLCSAGHPVPW